MGLSLNSPTPILARLSVLTKDFDAAGVLCMSNHLHELS